MTTKTYDAVFIRSVLRRTRSIAAVGISPNPIRPSNYVGRYLHRKGYRILPVNPRAVGQTLFDEPVRPDLAALAAEGVDVDMVDIFRRSEEAGALVDEAIAHRATFDLSTIWMQIGVVDEAAAARAEAAGLTVLMNICPKMEHQRLFGELRRAGIATGVISARRQ